MNNNSDLGVHKSHLCSLEKYCNRWLVYRLTAHKLGMNEKNKQIVAVANVYTCNQNLSIRPQFHNWCITTDKQNFISVKTNNDFSLDLQLLVVLNLCSHSFLDTDWRQSGCQWPHATDTFTHIHNSMWVKCVAPGQRLGEISNHQTSSYWTDPPAALKSRRAPGSQTPQKLLLNSSAQKKKVCRFWLHFFLRWAQTG